MPTIDPRTGRPTGIVDSAAPPPAAAPAPRTTAPFNSTPEAVIPRQPGAPGVPPPAAAPGGPAAPAAPAAPVTMAPFVPGTQGPAAPLPPPPSSADFDPVMGQVDPAHTVQGELGDILKNGNPLLEGAKTRAMQAANARGLQNSSMAVQSGEEAIVNTALPIAQADAAAYQKQQLTNQDITNQFLSQKEGAKLDLEKAYAAFQQNNYAFDRDEKLKRYINDSSISSNEKVAALQAAVQQTIANSQIAASKDNNAATIAANLKINDDTLAARLKEAGMTIDAQTARDIASFDHQDKVNLLNLSANQFTAFANGLAQLQTSQMEPADKDRAIANWNAVWNGRVPEAATYMHNTSAYPDAPATTTAPPPVNQDAVNNNNGSGTNSGGDGGG